MRNTIIKFLLMFCFVSYAMAQDDEEYEEDYIEEPIEMQLMKSLSVPLFWSADYNLLNGSLIKVTFPLEPIKYDLDDVLPKASDVKKKENKENKQKKFTGKTNVSWGGFLFATLVAIAGGGVAYYADLKAKEYRDEGAPASRAELDERIDAAKNWQMVRTLGYVLVGVGGFAMVYTVAF